MLRGTATGERDRIIILAHQSAVMARQERLKPLKHYLKQADQKPKAASASAVLDMMRRFKKRQDGKGSTDG